VLPTLVISFVSAVAPVVMTHLPTAMTHIGLADPEIPGWMKWLGEMVLTVLSSIAI
jgi:hypothetical protein